MFPPENLNARKLSFTFTYHFYWVLFCWLIKNKEKTKNRQFWVREIFRWRDKQGVLSNLLRELQLGEYYFK